MARQARLSEHPAAPGWSRGLSAAAGPGLAARRGWAAAEGGAPGTLPRGVCGASLAAGAPPLPGAVAPAASGGVAGARHSRGGAGAGASKVPGPAAPAPSGSARDRRSPG